MRKTEREIRESNASKLTDLLEALNQAKEDGDLLDEAWRLIGPYSNELDSGLSPEDSKSLSTFRTKLRDRFGFDDSE